MKNLLTLFIPLLALSATAQQFYPRTPMPFKRYSMGAATVNNKLYVMGGSCIDSLVKRVDEYDPATNTWTSRAPMLKAVTEFVTGVVNGKIYVIGGYDGSGGANDVQEYDPATNTWAYKAYMSTARSVISGAVVGNKIYVTCGWPAAYQQLEIYDPATNTWSSGANIPFGFLQNNGGTAIGNDMYIMGGRAYGGGAYDHNYKYSVSGNTWTSMAAMPDQLFSGFAVVFNSKIHYFGGSEGTDLAYFLPNHNTHYVYDPMADSWTTGMAMPKKRSGHIVVELGGRLYIAGGMDSVGKVTGELWSYPDTAVITSVCNEPTDTISNITPISASISWSPVAGAAGYLYEHNGTKNPTSPTFTTNTSYLAGPLTPNTKYYVHIRTVCAPGDSSVWVLDSLTTPVSVKDVHLAQLVTVHPNPVKNIVNLTMLGAKPGYIQVKLTDIRGAVLRTIRMEAENVAVDMSDLADGIYMLECSDGERRQVLKLTKQ